MTGEGVAHSKRRVEVGKKCAISRQATTDLTPCECRGRVMKAVLAALSLHDEAHSLPPTMQTDKVFEAFYHLQRKYPTWLSCLYFQNRAGSYVSRGLEDVLFSLGAFGLVTVENHDYRYLRLDESAKLAMKKRLKARIPDQLRSLTKMSNDFAELVKE